MIRKAVTSGKALLQLLRVTLVATVLAGIMCAAGTASAGLQSATWTEKADFENNASTTGTPTTRVNIDTDTPAGDVKIGIPKDLLSTASITCTANDRIYTIGAERASVAVIEASTKTLLKTISLPARPSGLVYNSINNKIYVGHYNDNKVSVIDPGLTPGSEVIKTVTVGNGAYAAAYNPTQTCNKVYVVNMTDHTVSVIDGASDTVINTVAVVAGPHTAKYDSSNNKAYITNKYNHSVSVIDGVTDLVDTTVQIEPAVAKIGDQAPGSIGLRVWAPSQGITHSDRMHLKWNYDTLGASQKIQFQLRTADDLALLDTAPYKGPDGTPDTWYEVSTSDAVTTSETDGTETTDIVLPNLTYVGAAELQVKLSSDNTASPVLHSVSLVFESFPDLTMTDVSGPATAKPGSTITVSSTALNQGTEPAGPFKVGIYLTDANGTRNLLCEREITSLAAVASDTASSTCTVPSLAAGSYYLEACADYTNQVVEGNESNNCKLGNTVEIIQPDLIITSVSGPPTGLVGKTINVSATVANQGTDSAGIFKVGIYLTDVNGTRNSLCEREITSLAAGGSDTANTICTVPAILPGTYTLAACADSNNQVTEINESNNCKSGNPISIAQPYPDLIISSVSCPATGTIGSTITVSTTVVNQGNDSAGTFKLGVYLVNIAKGIQYYLGERTVTSLAEGLSDSASNTFTVPAISTGDYYIQAIADPANMVAEGNETNNITRGNDIKISSTQPDLVVKSVSGTVVNGTLNYTIVVKNQGLSNTPISFNTGIFLSTDDNITTADRFVGTTSSINLAAGAEKIITGTKSVNLGTPPGYYYVGAFADYYKSVSEYDENNNTLASSSSQLIGPDIVITAVSGTVENGQLNYSVTVKNIGNMPAASFSSDGPIIELYFSADTTITGSDHYIGFVNTPLLAAGAEYTASDTKNAPADYPPNNYYFGAIADYDPYNPDINRILETDETNNALASNTSQYLYTDLVITAVSGTVINCPNCFLSYSATVKNLGNITATASTTGFYLSTDPTITESDAFVNSIYTPNLASGAETTVGDSYSLPANLAPGNYYVGAIADIYVYWPLNSEANENNNSRAGNQVTVP